MRSLPLLQALCLLAAVQLYAQDRPSLDSLTRIYADTRMQDSTRILALAEMAKQYHRSKPDTSLILARKAMEWATSIGYKRGEARAVNVVGLSHWIKSEHSTALEEFQRALILFEESNDKEGYAVCLNNIGLIYWYENDFMTALQYYTRSLEMQQQIGNANGIGLALNNVGLSYEKMNNLDKAIEYYQGALHVYEETGNKFGIAQSHTNMGYIQFALDNYSEALGHLNLAAKLQEEINDRSTLVSTLLGIAQIHEKEGRLDECIAVATRAVTMARELKSMYDVRDATKVLYTAYKNRNDLANALRLHEMYVDLNDSIFNVENGRAIATLEAKVALENKEKELVASRQQSTLRQHINYAVIGALVLMALFAWILVRNRARLQAAYNKLAVANRTLQEVKEEMEVKAGMLDASNRAKDKVFSVISHDLRSPLNALKGMFYLIESKAITKDEFLNYVPELSQRVNHSHAIVEELLQWSRSQMGAIEAKPVEFSVNEFIETEVDRSLPDAQSKGVRLSYNRAEENPVAFSDTDMLKTVLRNLVSNAIKFCRQGDEINVFAKEEGEMIHIYVSDTGVGIKREDLPRVFSGQGFTTVGTAFEKGTGVGLILTKEFVEKNGGTISVSSEEGNGTTFEFTIRRKPA